MALAPFGRHFHFHDVRRCNGVFSKTYKMHVKVSIAFKVVGGISSCNGASLAKY